MRVLPRPNVHIEAGSLGVIRNRQNESEDHYAILWIGGSVTNDTYMLSIIAKGYRLCFTSPPPSAQDPLRGSDSQGFIEDSGNVRANIPNASKESNLRDIFRHARVLLEHIPGRQGFWRVASSDRLKTAERPH